jgi:lysophospholipase L1-like esterase
MKRFFAFGLIAIFGSPLQAQTVNVRGKVSNGGGQPVANALVELVRQGAKDTTGSDGAYSLTKSGVSLGRLSAVHRGTVTLENGVLEFRVREPASLRIEVFDVKGNLQEKEGLPMAQPGSYHFDIPGASLPDHLMILRASIGAFAQTFRFLPPHKGISAGRFTLSDPKPSSGILAKSAAAVDSLSISAAGYAPKKIGLTSYDTTVNVTLAPDATTVYNPCPTNGNPCKLLPFGDSITEGVKSSDGAGYRSQLFKLIVAAKQKVTFVGSLADGPTTVSSTAFPRSHEGHAGWTIEPGFSEYGDVYGGISSLVPSPALNGSPDIILLHIGANDLFPTTSDSMAARLDALVEKIAKAAPAALIVLAQITPVGTANGDHTQAQVDAANAAQALYNSKIPGIIQAHAAKGQHIIGVDMSKMPLSDLTTASLHPNDKGYAYMADIWYPAIKDLLPK